MVPCWGKELNDILLTFAYKGFWFHVGKRNSMISYSRLPIKGFGFINLEFIHQAKEGLKLIATHSVRCRSSFAFNFACFAWLWSICFANFSVHQPFWLFCSKYYLITDYFLYELKEKWYHRTMQTFFQRKSSRHVYVRVEQDLKLAML